MIADPFANICLSATISTVSNFSPRSELVNNPFKFTGILASGGAAPALRKFSEADLPH